MADACRVVGSCFVCMYSDAVGIVLTFVILERIIDPYLFDKRTYTHAVEALQNVHAYLHSYVWAGLYCDTLYCDTLYSV